MRRPGRRTPALATALTAAALLAGCGPETEPPPDPSFGPSVEEPEGERHLFQDSGAGAQDAPPAEVQLPEGESVGGAYGAPQR